MALYTDDQQAAIDQALNNRRNDPSIQGGMTDAQKGAAPTSTSTAPPPPTTMPTTTPTTPTGGNAPTAQTAPTSSSVGASGGASSGYVPSQNLPGYNYTKPTWLDNMSIQDQLNYMKNDPSTAQLEINRAKQEHGDAIAKGDMVGAQKASAYADQIRQATGIANNDPFFGSVEGGLQSQGQANLSVNGQNPSSVNVYNGSSYDDASHLAQTLGLSYSRDQNGKPVIGGKTIDSSYIDKNGNVQVPTRLVGNLLGMKVDWDPSKSAVTITGGDKINQLPQQAGAGNTTWLGAIAGGIPQTPQLQQYQDPNLSYYQNQMMPYSQFNPNMTNYYDQAKNQLDPQAQASYNQLMGKQNLDINHMNDSMNQRGIYTSGIAQAAENDLRAKTTDAIASIFTKEQSDIAKTAQSLYDNAYKQFLSGNQFALKNNTEMLTQMMAEKKQAFTQYIQSQHLTMDQANYALKAWDAMSGYIYKNAQMEMQDQHFNQTMDFNQFKFDNLSADQTAQLHKSYDQMTQDWQKAMLPYQYQTANQTATTDIKQQALNASNYFKQLGINIDQSKLEELIRHNQAGESLSAAHLTATLANNKQNFDEKVRMDNANIDKANAQLTDTAKRTQLDGLKSELNATAQRINSHVTQNQQVPQTLIDNYNTIKSSIEKIISPNGATSTPDAGTSDNSFDASNQF